MDSDEAAAGSSRHDGRGAPSVATLGMFILDTFRYEDEQTGQDLGDHGKGEQIGGGGTYFAVGARIWLDPMQVLMTIDTGSDFPVHVKEALETYAQGAQRLFTQNKEERRGTKTALWRYRSRSDGTTRAVNIFRGEQRSFAYLTPKKRLDPVDLLDHENTTLPPFIHFICSPDRAKEICKQVDELQNRWCNGMRPILVWEPIPDSAKPENLDQALTVCSQVDVLSPNHDESASFLSCNPAASTSYTVAEQMQLVEDMGRNWFLQMRKHQSRAGTTQTPSTPVVCIRAGAHGSLLACRPRSQATPAGYDGDLNSRHCFTAWVPAYHTPEERNKVVDVTGAGNAWLGGFTAGLAGRQQRARSSAQLPIEWTRSELVEAAQMGSVSASYAIEQQGLPDMQIDAQGKTLWNGDSPHTRCKRLQQQMAS